jgi:transmembrane protein TMEM174 (potassium channel)
MAAPSDRWHPLARAEQVEYDRVLFFSDAVFAIAITLLTVDLQVPEGPVESGEQPRETLPQMGGFALSFAVIGLFRYISGCTPCASASWPCPASRPRRTAGSCCGPS